MKLRVVFLAFTVFSLLWGGGIRIPRAFSADFLQKVSNEKKKVILYQGKIMMNYPSSLKWIYRKPTNKEVCSDGKRVVVVDHDLEQVSFYRMQKKFDLASVLRNAKHYKGKLYVAKYGGKNYTIAVDSKGRIEQIAYRDDLDNVVNIHFRHLRYKKHPFQEKQLRCKIPQEYDRIGG